MPLDCDHIEDSLRATSPAVLDGTQVVIGIEGEVGFVQSYDVSDGTFLWGHRAVAQSPPVAALRHIYVVTPTRLRELDGNGKLVSAAPLQGEGGGVSLSLDFVYVMTSEGIHSIPFDPAKPSSFDGLTLDRTHYGYSVPTIAADGTIYFSSPNGFLTAYRNAPLGPFDFPRELPHATWISPQDGQAIGYTAGRPMLVTFTGSLTGEVAISSNVDGLICQVAVDGAGEATCTTSMPMSLGDHVLTVFATDQSGEQLTAQVTVSVINNAPTVHITSPMDQTYLYSTVTNTLTAQVTDADETIPDARIQWKSDVQGALGAGRSLDVTLINGNHTLTCTATDEKGAQTTASVHVTVTVPIP